MQRIKLATSRSLTFPIVMAAVTVPMGLFVLIGWIWVLLQNQELSQQVTSNTGMMIAGVVSLITIIAALVLLTVFLSREILETRRQRRFIDSVTHELKSPLAALKLCTQTLDHPKLPEEKRQDLQQMMIDDIDRLSFFIDDILEASRIANGTTEKRHNWLMLDSELDVVASRICSRYHLKLEHIKIENHYTNPFFTDQTALVMVLRNLLDNAVKYSMPSPEVHCTIKPTNYTQLSISIKDNGIGIPLAHQHRVFDRFFRAPGEAVNNRSGSGLGLYVAAQLVRGLGGRLKLESPGHNQGCRFYFTLPIDKNRSNHE